jgi:GNAT superfamily N-acetyltransferase
MENASEWRLPDGLSVVLAQPLDIDAILTIWADADEWVRRRGFEPGEPPMPLRDIISSRISCAACYVVRRSGPTGEIVGTITLEWADDGVWSDRVTDDACYVHGLATQRASAGQGIGAALLRWAEELAHTTGKNYLRLDCDANNGALRAYYAGVGLTHCGEVSTPTHHASRFEKRIQS